MRVVRVFTVISLCFALSGCAVSSAHFSPAGRWGGDIVASDGHNAAHARLTVSFAGDGRWSAVERIDGVPAPLRFNGAWALGTDGHTVEILRDPGRGLGAEATIDGDRLVTRVGQSTSVLTRLHWWQLR